MAEVLEELKGRSQQFVPSVPLLKRVWIKGKGAVATLLVQQGTLHVQDPIVVGNTSDVSVL